MASLTYEHLASLQKGLVSTSWHYTGSKEIWYQEYHIYYDMAMYNHVYKGSLGHATRCLHVNRGRHLEQKQAASTTSPDGTSSRSLWVPLKLFRRGGERFRKVKSYGKGIKIYKRALGRGLGTEDWVKFSMFTSNSNRHCAYKGLDGSRIMLRDHGTGGPWHFKRARRTARRDFVARARCLTASWAYESVLHVSTLCIYRTCFVDWYYVYIHSRIS